MPGCGYSTVGEVLLDSFENGGRKEEKEEEIIPDGKGFLTPLLKDEVSRLEVTLHNGMYLCAESGAIVLADCPLLQLDAPCRVRREDGTLSSCPDDIMFAKADCEIAKSEDKLIIVTLRVTEGFVSQKEEIERVESHDDAANEDDTYSLVLRDVWTDPKCCRTEVDSNPQLSGLFTRTPYHYAFRCADGSTNDGYSSYDYAKCNFRVNKGVKFLIGLSGHKRDESYGIIEIEKEKPPARKTPEELGHRWEIGKIAPKELKEKWGKLPVTKGPVKNNSLLPSNKEFRETLKTLGISSNTMGDVLHCLKHLGYTRYFSALRGGPKGPSQEGERVLREMEFTPEQISEIDSGLRAVGFRPTKPKPIQTTHFPNMNIMSTLMARQRIGVRS